MRPDLRVKGRLISRLLSCGLAFWLLGWAPPASAAEEATFYLEKIEVDDVSPAVGAIVLSQSLLKEGSPYSETDLHDALSRIRRLPFVRDAELALLKGSSRGAYRLRITVEKMSPLFVQGTSSLSLFGESVRLRETGESLFENGAAVGLRDFLGPQGMIFAGIGTAGSTYGEIGYTQYGLFGTGGYAAADLQYSRSGNVLVLPFLADPSVSGWDVSNAFAARLAVGVPIRKNDSVRASFFRVAGDVREVEPVFGPSNPLGPFTTGRLSFDQTNLDWLHDTTDDALFPTRGLFLAAGAGLLNANGPESFTFIPSIPLPLLQTHTVFVSLSATRYLPVTDRQTVLGSLESYVGRTRLDDLPRETTFGLTGRLGHSVSLWSSQKSRDIDDLRIETVLEYNYEKAPPYSRFEFLRIGTGAVLRSRWGLLRLGVSYTVFDRGGP